MMINPGPSDSTAVFALLTAISSPEAAKASLQEILDASEAYQKTIEDFRQEFKKTSEELDAKAADAEAKLAAATKIQTDFDMSYDKKSKKLDKLSSDLDYRQSVIEDVERTQAEEDKDLMARTIEVGKREVSVSAREAEVNKLNETAQAMKDDYENKLVALKALTN